jgi:N-acetylglutamate synthase-like GNAT family acetyltransferase
LADFIIRPARKDDFPAIRSLIFAVRINPTGLDWRRFLVAVSPAGEVFGCGQIKLHGDGSRELASIAVREQARGQGAARALVEELVRQETARPLYLMCRAALGLFYAKFGFREIVPEEMTPYFRRVSRIAGLFGHHAGARERLLVMRLG